jgi:hypothetical protein
VHRVRLPVDGHPLLVHHLQQGRLGPGRGAVDLVADHEVGEDRPRAELERVAALVVHGHAGDVGGQQVGGELDATPAPVDGGGQRPGQRRLAHTGHVLDQQVALDAEARHGQVDHVGSTAHGPADVGDQQLVSFREPLQHPGGRLVADRGLGQ